MKEISRVEIVGLNELQARWKLGQFPLLVRRGGCTIKKWSAASTSAQPGWLFKNPLQNNHSGASRHPSWPGGVVAFHYARCLPDMRELREARPRSSASGVRRPEHSCCRDKAPEQCAFRRELYRVPYGKR